MFFCYQDYSLQCDCLKIDKIVKSGSLGRGTATAHSDIDLVFVINCDLESFAGAVPTLLVVLEVLLKENVEKLKISPASFRRTRYSLQFTCCDIDVDLLPACKAAVDMDVEDFREKVLQTLPRRSICYFSASSCLRQVNTAP